MNHRRISAAAVPAAAILAAGDRGAARFASLILFAGSGAMVWKRMIAGSLTASQEKCAGVPTFHFPSSDNAAARSTSV